MRDLLRRIQTTPSCRVESPVGLPTIRSSLCLPDDVQEFYSLCGGVFLAEHTPYAMALVAPSSFTLANPVVLGNIIVQAQKLQGEDDISWSWYIMATCGNGEYLVIDLNKERLGRCYDGFHETYGLVGQTPIIARSFTELLTRLYENRGQYWYWLRPDFVSPGDAYDRV